LIGRYDSETIGPKTSHPNQNENEVDSEHEKEHQHEIDSEHEDEHENEHV